ncbi:hypothetical protein GCM10007392_35280 [Saccharospirillum salsuginis]|uniref:Uncharacterized protein n=1 Tax=Saccharospirillum salsuginis TaxID=418750 RepID=A0A918KHZ7_9GAMM|nr:hypothetical protein GCM10007392_35280 [Saccharospirillum salsuginis]
MAQICRKFHFFPKDLIILYKDVKKYRISLPNRLVHFADELKFEIQFKGTFIANFRSNTFAVPNNPYS